MKKFAPIIIVLIISNLLLLYLCSVIVLAIIGHNTILSIILGFVAICIISVIVAFIVTLRTRLKEIDKEDEEDDLSKY
ncbi:MAG: hypothetical protein CVV02_14390 [Firmicutes bacterium HGW-Firmicutes-7]|nr:MAG: hypothetical protein CVV02_14390 [Firmicutes bacterium HGW-Firmicutes-7]